MITNIFEKHVTKRQVSNLRPLIQKFDALLIMPVLLSDASIYYTNI